MSQISDPTAPSAFPNKWAIMIVAAIVVICAVACVVIAVRATS